MIEYKRLKEVAGLAGISPSTLLEHEKAGKIPPPDRLGIGRYYTPDQVRRIVVYFAGRRPWDRIKKEDKNSE